MNFNANTATRACSGGQIAPRAPVSVGEGERFEPSVSGAEGRYERTAEQGKVRWLYL